MDKNSIAHVTKSRERFKIETSAMQDAAMRACRQAASVGDIARGAQAIADWVDAGAMWDVYWDHFPPAARLNPSA